jgi:hypothetical protein
MNKKEKGDVLCNPHFGATANHGILLCAGDDGGGFGPDLNPNPQTKKGGPFRSRPFLFPVGKIRIT